MNSSSQEPVAESHVVVPGNQGTKIVRAVTVRRPAEDLYRFWRSLENIPLIVKTPITITSVSAVESHWVVEAPLSDAKIEWDAFIINDEPGRLIAWRSNDGAEVANAGTIRFEPAPDPEETEVTVTFQFDPPGGRFGAWLAKLSPEAPGRQTMEALRRFKALMEAGEIPTTEGQSVGRPQSKKRKTK